MRSLIAALVLFFVVVAHAQSVDAFAGSKLSEPEAARLKERLRAPLAEGASPAQIEAYFKGMDAAALRLGDLLERERVLREWNQVSRSVDARWTYASYLINSEKVDEGFVQFEALIKDLKAPNEKVRARARLAIAYIDQSNLKRAQTLLDEASQIIKNEFVATRTGAVAYWYLRAEMEYFNIRSRLNMRQGRFVDAQEASRQANLRGIALQDVDSLVDERQRNYSRMGHAWAATEAALPPIAMGRFVDADDTLRQAYALYKKYGLTEDTMVDFYRRVAELRFNEGRYFDAIALYRKVQGIQSRQGVNSASTQAMVTRTGIVRCMVAAGLWDEAAKEFSDMDSLAGNNTMLGNIARQSEFRAQVYMQVGPLSRARSVMAGTLKWHVDNLGPGHYYTAMMRGLYAVTLTVNPSGSDLANARREFETSVRDMTAPGSLSADFQDNAYRKVLKNLILKSYLHLLSAPDRPGEADAAEAFKAANHLIASSVQEAIAESAARAGISQPGLAALVRKDQDARNELGVLYAYVAAQNGEGTNRSNPTVLNAMHEHMKELEDLRRDVKERVQKEFPEYFALLQPRAPTPKEVAAQLRADELFLALLPQDNGTYVFAVAPGGRLVFIRSALNATQVGAMVQRIRATLDVADKGERAPAFDFATAFALYDALLQPQEPLMRNAKHLIVAASGALGQLPLAVLPTRAWSGTAEPQAPWLIRQYAISSVPSASAWMSLQKLAKTPSGKQSMMAWGDPRFVITASVPAGQAGSAAGVSRSVTRALNAARQQQSFDFDKPKVDVLRYAELPALPETRDELLALGKAMHADIAHDLLLGEAATRASVLEASNDGRLASRQVVVFATHGLLPGDLPHLEQPALALAGSTQKDASPLLTLDDVLGLRMNADWVVLSACNTAGADGKAEEAMSGLARGFFYAGSRSLLVTHWSVESESAMLLTTGTFDKYQSDPTVTRSEALRSAMLKVMAMKPYAHPAFWAPYALVGEGGR